MSNRVELISILERPVVKASSEGLLNVLIKISGQSDATEKRPPLNLSFVIDRSGSMQGEKIAYTKDALEFCIRNTLPEDRQSVVLFDNEVQTLIPHGPILNKDLAAGMIRQIRPGGTTNLSGGICRGEQCLEALLEQKLVNRMIVMTDGLANQGICEPDGLLDLARKIALRQISISTVGVGEHYNENLLQDMAEAGCGNYYYIQNPDEIPDIFARELLELQKTVAQNLVLRISLPAGVLLNRSYGYIPHLVSETGAEFILPDLSGGEEKVLLLQFRVGPSAAGSLLLADIALGYMDAASHDKVVIPQKLEVTATQDESLLSAMPDVSVKENETLFIIAEAQEEIVKIADLGDFEGSRLRVQEARDMLLLESACYGFEAAEALDDLDRMEEQLLSKATFTAHARKEMRSTAYKRTKHRN